MSEKPDTGAPSPSQGPWQEAVDPQLLRRLLRPLEQPGLIPLGLARRIFAGVEAMAGRLPLLAWLARRHGLKEGFQAGQIPLIYARWVAAGGREAMGTAPAPGAGVASPPRERIVVQVAPTAARSTLAPMAPAAAPRRAQGAEERAELAPVPIHAAPPPSAQPVAAQPVGESRPPSPLPATRAPAPESPLHGDARPPARDTAPPTRDTAPPARDAAPPPPSHADPRARRSIAPSALEPRRPPSRVFALPTAAPGVERAGPGTTAPRVRPLAQPGGEARLQVVHPSGAPGPRIAAASAPATPPPSRAFPSPPGPMPRPRIEPRRAIGGEQGWGGARTPLVHAPAAQGASPTPGGAFPTYAPGPGAFPARGMATAPGYPIAPGTEGPEAPSRAAGSPSARPGAVEGVGPATPRPARPQIDVDDLVDKVQRKLLRQIAEERARRGRAR